MLESVACQKERGGRGEREERDEDEVEEALDEVEEALNEEEEALDEVKEALDEVEEAKNDFGDTFTLVQILGKMFELRCLFTNRRPTPVPAKFKIFEVRSPSFRGP